jgi:hypothetical protein
VWGSHPTHVKIGICKFSFLVILVRNLLATYCQFNHCRCRINVYMYNIQVPGCAIFGRWCQSPGARCFQRSCCSYHLPFGYFGYGYTNFKSLIAKGQTLHIPDSESRSCLSAYSKIQSVNLSNMPRKFAAGWHPSGRKPSSGFLRDPRSSGCLPKVYLLYHPRKKQEKKGWWQFWR